MSNFIESTTKSLETVVSELADNPSLFLRNHNTDFTRNRKIDFKTLIGITMNSGGYQLLACDGSNLSIASNQNDPETAWKHNQLGGITNHLHLNAFYDVLNRVYTDALIQTASEYHEHRACIQMLERANQENVILVADRGYENYNIIAHAINKGWNFVIRIKDIGSNGIASGLKLPSNDSFDKDIDITLTRKQSKVKKQAGYKFIPNKLKEIYQLRWGIETSFRELKYAIGLTSFHSKKVDYIKQEIFARLTLYNYCELITSYVVEQSKISEKTKQVNFTIAIYICREYLRKKRQLSPPDVIKLIKKHTLPVRPGRRDPRKVKAQASVSFLYRVA